MCIVLPGQPLWLPELNSLAGFKITEKKNGVHVARKDFSYPIQALRIDPEAIWGDHDHCLHFALDRDAAEDNLLGDYGSHLLFCALPPGHFWSREMGDERCLHGDMTVPLACLTCGEGQLEPEIIDATWQPVPSSNGRSPSDPFSWLRQLPVVAS
ncbi:hypothetical protein BH23CHL2_BH23CHL2_19600 [soil metagenome]